MLLMVLVFVLQIEVRNVGYKIPVDEIFKQQ
jgi:hypothetical protein